jgi:hypothetical protein
MIMTIISASLYLKIKDGVEGVDNIPFTIAKYDSNSETFEIVPGPDGSTNPKFSNAFSDIPTFLCADMKEIINCATRA